MIINLYTDGGSRGNPGPAGIGAVILDEHKKVLKEVSEFIGNGTNNQAEYTALIRGLEEALKLNPTKINCFLDSELVVKQLNKEYKVKNPEIKELYGKVLDLVIFREISFSHVRREQNKEADKLVNEALDANT